MPHVPAGAVRLDVAWEAAPGCRAGTRPSPVQTFSRCDGSRNLVTTKSAGPVRELRSIPCDPSQSLVPLRRFFAKAIYPSLGPGATGTPGVSCLQVKASLSSPGWPRVESTPVEKNSAPFSGPIPAQSDPRDQTRAQRGCLDPKTDAQAGLKAPAVNGTSSQLSAEGG